MWKIVLWYKFTYKYYYLVNEHVHLHKKKPNLHSTHTKTRPHHSPEWETVPSIKQAWAQLWWYQNIKLKKNLPLSKSGPSFPFIWVYLRMLCTKINEFWRIFFNLLLYFVQNIIEIGWVVLEKKMKMLKRN